MSLKKIKILSIKVTHSSSLLRQLILIFYLFHSENKKRRMKRGLHREKKKSMFSLYWESSLCNIVSNMIFSVEASLKWQEKHVTHLPHVPIHTFLIWPNIFPCNFFLVVNKFPPLYYLYSLHGIDKVENRITKGCLVLPLVQSPIKKKKRWASILQPSFCFPMLGSIHGGPTSEPHPSTEVSEFRHFPFITLSWLVMATKDKELDVCICLIVYGLSLYWGPTDKRNMK